MVVEYYLIFSLTVAVVSLAVHFVPCLNEMTEAGIYNEINNSKYISCLVYFCVAFILAPLLFLATIIPATSERYKQGVYTALTEDKN